MQTLFSKMRIKVSGILIIVAVLAVAGVLAPRVGHQTKAESANCSPTYSEPIFNPYPEAPVGATQTNGCQDLVVLAGNLVGSGVFSDNITANVGDTIDLRIWVHNGAAENSGAVMHGTRYAVSFDSNPGTSHSVSALLSASNAGSKSGQIVINTPDGAHLEQAGGNFSSDVTSLGQPAGDLLPCFDYGQQITISLKVVGSQPTGRNTITATPGGQFGSQCLRTGTVSWTNASNVETVEVTVQDITANSSVNSMTGPTGPVNYTTTSDWLTPGDTYQYIMYDTTNGRHDEIARTTEVVPALNCGAPAPTGTTSVVATPNSICLANGLVGGNLTWTNKSNVETVEVTVQNVTANSSVNSMTGPTGPANYTTTTNWLNPGDTYRYIMYDTTGGKHDEIIRISKATPNVNCGEPAPTGRNTITATPGGQFGSQCLRTGTVSWTNASNVETVEVTVQDITANSSVNSMTGPTGPVNYTTTSDWLTPGDTYQYIMYDTTNGRHDEIARTTEVVPALNCGSPQNPVTCSVSPAVIDAGQSAVFTAANGDGNYSWIVNGGSIRSYNGKSFYSRFDDAGNFTATVSSAGKTASCSVAVTSVETCVINGNAAINSTAPVKQGQTYTTVISWTSTGGHKIKITRINPGSYSETPIVTNGNNTGSINVGNLQAGSQYLFKMYDTSSCGGYLASITVNTPANLGQLVCVVGSSIINSGQQANFTASGGDDPYTWTDGGNTATGSHYNPTYTNNTQNPITRSVSVRSNDGQTANCSVIVNGQAPAQKGRIGIDKKVRNVSANESSFAQSTNAKTNEVVEYQLTVSAQTSVTLTNVTVTDSFVNGLTYVNGSLTVNGQSHTPGLTNGGLHFNYLSQGSPIVIKYQLRVSVFSGSLVNTATATAQNSDNTTQDQAIVTVVFVNPGQPALTITKQVKTSNTGYGSSVNANTNDAVYYQVVIRNVGQAKALNVFFSDSNPSGVLPLTNLTVSKTYSGTISTGISLGDLNVGETVTITYQGRVNISSGTVTNTATVSADNAASQTASAQVTVSAGGGGGSTTINTCVNNSCNTTNTTNNNYYNNTSTYYYSYSGGGGYVPYNQYSQLSITKNVRQVNGGTYQNSITANNGDVVQFEIVVSNSGNATANNVRLTDNLPSGLSLITGTVLVNGSYSSDGSLYGSVYLGNLAPGQQSRVNFQARVNSNSTIQNTASANSDNAGSVQASAWVFIGGNVLGGNVNLSYSKSAFNETKNQSAASVIAGKEDFITYTLTVSNSGNTPATGFVITDDLSQVLPYADMVDNGGGQVSGNAISYPGITVPANGSVSRSFKVRVKFGLANNLSYVMTNTYGNTITVRINAPKVLGAFVAPRTGADSMGVLFSTVLTGAVAAFRKRKVLIKAIFA